MLGLYCVCSRYCAFPTLIYLHRREHETEKLSNLPEISICDVMLRGNGTSEPEDFTSGSLGVIRVTKSLCSEGLEEGASELT
jgi:hypothetical protein